jgi:hypothetical protein
MTHPVRDNGAAQRFEMDVGGKIAFITYRRTAQVLTLLRIKVPAQFEGKGIGSQLTRGALELARAARVKVVPRCTFVAHYIARHTEFRNLLVAER